MKFKRENKIVGVYNPTTNIFSKKIDMEKHFFRKTRSFGIDLETYRQLDPTCKIILTTEDKTYSTDWVTYAAWGTVENYGHGRQIMMCIDKFNQDESQKNLLQN